MYIQNELEYVYLNITNTNNIFFLPNDWRKMLLC